ATATPSKQTPSRVRVPASPPPVSCSRSPADAQGGADRVSEENSGDACDAARSQNFGSRSDNAHPTAASTGRPRFVITFTPGPGVDAIRSIRLLLKAAKRRFGLVATDAYEDRSAPLQISNQAADEFRERRDEVVAERAQAWRKP